ncbi:MAG: LPS translocon maturation chaperone LptM [Gammaproteobacteria bacterium]
MKPTTFALTAFLLTLTLAGCGQSGPLYVPGDPSSIKAPPEPANSGEESDENGENGKNGEEADSP